MFSSYYSLKGYKHVHRELLVYCQALFGVEISILLLHLPPKTKVNKKKNNKLQFKMSAVYKKKDMI